MTAASFTKVAFAYMVMKLVDEKILDLDQPVYKYLSKPLPEYPEYKELANDPRAKRITARMLLSHTSGFPNWRAFEDDRKLKIHFEPGSRYAYSGEGIVLLQLVVETVTKRPLAELMSQHVFKRQRCALHRSADAFGKTRMNAWLYSGVAGVGWTLEHLTGDDADADDPGDAVDERLLRFMQKPEALPWELVGGVAGIAVYALQRLRRPVARQLAERVARHLANSASRLDDGTRWLSKPEWDPVNHHAAPYANFGIAHGFPGAIAAVAALVKNAILEEELGPILADASHWLLAQRLSKDTEAWFRYGSDDPGAPARTAWCYGDPGVAWTLMLAADALGDRALWEDAVAIATHAAERAPSASGVVDAGLCHGAAGLGHLFHRMHRLHPEEPALRRAARDWFARALDMRSADAPLAGFRAWTPVKLPTFQWTDDAGALTGAAGVALALVTALDAEVIGWDLPLLVTGDVGRP
jgi:CubicO group peptidase (beta-lactamase class C family)